MKKSILLLAILFVGSIMNYSFNKKAAATSLPNITLEDMNGQKINVAELGKSGKITVISFWATWCTPCKKELTNMIDMAAEWKDKNVAEVVAVSIDDSRQKAKIKTYVDGAKWPYMVLLDQNQDLKRALNFQSVPYTIIIDKEGKIVDTHQGYTEGDEFELQEKVEKLAGTK
jgi:cytochrome c biogenesis protein CcmG/thiol:disulfide interchange protein DsbE